MRMADRGLSRCKKKEIKCKIDSSWSARASPVWVNAMPGTGGDSLRMRVIETYSSYWRWSRLIVPSRCTLCFYLRGRDKKSTRWEEAVEWGKRQEEAMPWKRGKKGGGGHMQMKSKHCITQKHISIQAQGSVRPKKTLITDDISSSSSH